MPLAFLGAGLSVVTFSACYGPACATTVKLPDGGTQTDFSGFCGTYDCTTGPDGGAPVRDSKWRSLCEPRTSDTSSDGGVQDGGSPSDGGADAGP
jgi:hypothetical protein